MTTIAMFNPENLPPPDQYGYFLHPDIPSIDEDSDLDLQALCRKLGYDIAVVEFEFDATEALHDEYYEREDLTAVSRWTPTPPGDGEWILVAKYDSEEGPCALFAHPTLHFVAPNMAQKHSTQDQHDDGQLLRPDIDMLHPSPTNPRKNFPEESLAELAESIKLHDIMQPIIVREMPETMRAQLGTTARLEIVAGERRWRAARIAKLESVPVLLRELTDAQVIALQIIENLQREGLSAIEEAEGYDVLRRQGMSAGKIAETVGKSKAYIHAKLKLLALGQEGRDKLRAGELSESVALLVSRIPAALQARAVARLSEADHLGNRPSVRAATSILRQDFSANLTHARFSLDDAEITPAAGACSQCPKRDEESADVCTDPGCFTQKQEAHVAHTLAQAAERGQRIITGSEARDIKPSAHCCAQGGYVELHSHCYELDGYPTYAELLAQATTPVEISILDAHHQASEVVKKSDLAAALRGTGIELDGAERAEKRAQEKAMEEAELAAENKFRGRLFDQVRKQPVLMLTTPDLQMLATFCVTRLYEGTRINLAKLRFPNQKGRAAVECLITQIQEMSDAELMALLRDAMLISESHKDGAWDNRPPTQLLATAARLGIDPEQIRAGIEREERGVITVYRNPVHPEVEWHGKGKPPLWIDTWISQGHPLEDLAVEVPAPKQKGKKK